MKTNLLTLCAILCVATHSLCGQSEPDTYFGDLEPAGNGWYYDNVFGFIYPLGNSWYYTYSLDASLAITGGEPEMDVHYTWDSCLGWGYISRDTASWIYYYDTDGTENDLDKVEAGWYYSYGLATGGLAPKTYYSDSLGQNVNVALVVEIVNGTLNAPSDSAKIPSDNIYVTLYGGAGSFQPGTITENTSFTLSSQSRFTINSFASGRLFISYDTKNTNGTFQPGTGVMPTEQSEIQPQLTTLPRNDKIELTYAVSSGIPGGSANLTAVDYFGIPMTIESLDAAGNVLQSFTYFKNTGTIIANLQAVNSPEVKNSATIEDVNGNFLRIISPKDDPSPWPSLAAYFDHVSGDTVKITGRFDGSTTQAAQYYDYTTTLASSGNVTLTGSIAPVLAGGGPGTYTTGDTLVITATDLLNGIYGANPPYTKNGAAGTIADNDVYSAVMRDLLTGFNAGYIGGTYSSDPSNTWWTKPPFQTQDGGKKYYNEYAAVIQADGQAYGFPFSDRLREQLLNFNSSVATLRITILPDDMLEAPVASVEKIENTAVTLKWDAVPGATGYEITYSPPATGTTVQAGKVTSYKVTGLQEGTPYNFAVRATKGSSVSPAYNVMATTSGEPPIITGEGQWQLAVTFASSMVEEGDTVTINGAVADIETSGTISYQNGQIFTYTLTNDGGNYSAPPSVSVSGGGGYNATATPTLNGPTGQTGGVTALSSYNVGFGYTSVPTVVIDDTFEQEPATYTANVTYTTQAVIPLPAPVNSTLSYTFSWKRKDGTAVFETIMHVTTKGLNATNGTPQAGNLIDVSNNSADTYLANNQFPASFSSVTPWVVNLTVQPNN